MQGRYKGVEGLGRKARGYMGLQRQYKGVEGVGRKARDIWDCKDDARDCKDDARE